MLPGLLILAFAMSGAPEADKLVHSEDVAKAASDQTAEADKVICKRVQKTGSLISRSKICMSARDWAFQSQANQDEWGGAGKPGASSGN